MKHAFIRVFTAFCAVLLLTALVSAQSLGDVARAERAKKAAGATTAKKKPKLYTNDDIPKEGGLSTGGVVAVAPAPAGGKGAEAAKPGEAPKDSAASAAKEGDKPTDAELEKDYRAKFAKLRDNLATEEKKLDILQRELNLANVQYYSNPDQALREQTTRNEINTKTADIEKQKVAVEAAKKAISDLEQELHQKGLPPGWAR